jgi:hypothetical protein
MKTMATRWAGLVVGGWLLAAGGMPCPSAWAQTEAAKPPTCVRFRSGWVLAAEAAPENPDQPLAIANLSPHEPEASPMADVGHAAVVVRLDPGRTLGLYDFALEDGARRQYPCLAVRIDDKDYDAGAWQLAKTSPDRRYTLLFRVPVRPSADLGYTLKFTLFGDNEVAPALAFRRVAAVDQFTPPASIPDEGILGIDPTATPPPEATAPTDPDAAPTVADVPAVTPPTPPPPAATPAAAPGVPVRGQQPSAADIDAWSKLLGPAPTPAPASDPDPASDPAPASAAPLASVPATGSAIRFAPRGDNEHRMLNGVFEGSNGDPQAGPYTVIHTITSTPSSGWNQVVVDLGSWRYLRYRAPGGSNCNIAEIEFYRNGQKLTGTPFGTEGSFKDEGNTLHKVFDGNTGTFFDAPMPDGAYVGLDTGGGAAPAPPAGGAGGWDDWN